MTSNQLTPEQRAAARMLAGRSLPRATAPAWASLWCSNPTRPELSQMAQGIGLGAWAPSPAFTRRDVGSARRNAPFRV